MILESHLWEMTLISSYHWLMVITCALVFNDFSFKLIDDKYIKLNGQFVLPAKDESHYFKCHNF